MKKSDSTNKMITFKVHQEKCSKIIDEIVGNKKYHKKEILQPVIDAMEELIFLTEEKLKKS